MLLLDPVENLVWDALTTKIAFLYRATIQSKHTREFEQILVAGSTLWRSRKPSHEAASVKQYRKRLRHDNLALKLAQNIFIAEQEVLFLASGIGIHLHATVLGQQHLRSAKTFRQFASQNLTLNSLLRQQPRSQGHESHPSLACLVPQQPLHPHSSWMQPLARWCHRRSAETCRRKTRRCIDCSPIVKKPYTLLRQKHTFISGTRRLISTRSARGANLRAENCEIHAHWSVKIRMRFQHDEDSPLWGLMSKQSFRVLDIPRTDAKFVTVKLQGIVCVCSGAEGHVRASLARPPSLSLGTGQWGWVF